MVRKTYARGHWAKTRKLEPLPGPDVPDDELELHLDLPGDDEDDGAAGPARPAFGDDPARDQPSDDDEPVRPLGFPGRGGKAKATQSARKPRVNVTTRKDIAAKVGMLLYVPGKIWETRDPWCGGTFVAQLPATTEALTDIICDSADLVAFFTGPAGGFMKYLNLMTALAPVAQVAYGHHISHTIGQAGEQVPAPDMTAYAA